MRNLFLSASAAGLLFAAPAFAQVGLGIGSGGSVTAPIATPGATVSGQAGATLGAMTRDPVAAATDIASPTSRAAQAAAKEAKDKADEAAAAASNTSANVGVSGSTGATMTTTPGVGSTLSGSATTSGAIGGGMSGSAGAAGGLAALTPLR